MTDRSRRFPARWENPDAPAVAEHPYFETYGSTGSNVTAHPIDSDEVIFELIAKYRHGDGTLVTMARPYRVKVRVQDDALMIYAERGIVIGADSTNQIRVRLRALDEIE